MKARLAAAVANVLLLAATLLAMEGAFRLLPVSHPPHLLPVNAERPVVRFEPSVEYVYSRDWNFSVVTRKRSNNYGYMHVADYRPDDSSPLMAVIGDSFVEAHVVNGGQSFPERLHEAVRGRGRVYSFGVSGAPLSQYLVFAEFARKVFRPSAMVFVVIGNDFDESLLKYKAEPRFHYFAGENGRVELRRIDYALSPAKKWLRHSALVRYAVLNLSAEHRIAALVERLRRAPEENAAAREKRMADSERAVDLFFEQLPARSGLAPQSILFVLDAVRPAMYSERALAASAGEPWPRLRRYFMARAAALGYRVLDIQPAFLRRHKADGSRFEAAPTDSHWNALGHQLVADEIARGPLFARIFRRPAVQP